VVLLFWIIIGALAGSYGPVDRTEAMRWRSNGIKRVLFLVTDKSTVEKYKEYKLFGFKYRVEEYDPKLPLSVEKLKEISAWIHKNIGNFMPTVIVCEENPTIASTFLAAYLIYRGIALVSILMLFMKKSKYVVMPTQEQISLLSLFEVEMRRD